MKFTHLVIAADRRRRRRIVLVQVVGEMEFVVGRDRYQGQATQAELAAQRRAGSRVVRACIVVVAEFRIVRTGGHARKDSRDRLARRVSQQRRGIHRNEGTTHRRFAIHVVSRQSQRDIIRRFPLEFGPRIEGFAPVRVFAVEQVREIAIPLRIRCRCDVAECRVDWTGHTDSAAILVIISPHGAEVRLERVRGLLRDDVDQAGGCRLAVQRALRTAQNFYSFHVRQVAERARLKGKRHFIHQYRDAGFDTNAEGKRADAAQGHVGIGGMLGWPDRQRRRNFAEVRKLGHARSLQRLPADGGNGERHFLKILFTLVRRDDDFVEGSRAAFRACGVGFIGCSRRQRCTGQRHGDCESDRPSGQVIGFGNFSHDHLPHVWQRSG